MNTLYSEDLAYIQAKAYSAYAAAATPEVIALLQAGGISGGRLVDVGCGAGESTRCFVNAGFEVWAIDPSAALIDYARRAAPNAHFAEPQSAYDAVLPAVDAVVAIGEPLTYHRKGEDADALVRRFLDKVAGALRPGGMFLFDVIVAGSPALDARIWRTGEDWAILVDSVEDATEGWLTRDIETFRRMGDTYRRQSESHDVKLFRQELMERWLRQAGFEVQVAPGYGSFRLPPRRVAFIATRNC